jgi:hypothetical protein
MLWSETAHQRERWARHDAKGGNDKASTCLPRSPDSVVTKVVYREDKDFERPLG